VSQVLWFASRGTGLVSLLLLTATVALGAAHTGRLAGRAGTRFAMATLHRDLSLVVLAFLTIHVTTAIIDPYASIRWVDALVPWVSSYQPLWLGLGTVAFDLLLATLVTSLVRTRLSHRFWRAVHWSAYVCWPVAVVHGIGIGGADSRIPWVLAIDAGCVVAVLAAVGWRVAVRHPDTAVRQEARSRLR
jgi:predicted ferric reductase